MAVCYPRNRVAHIGMAASLGLPLAKIGLF